jgi:hypothetical protein
MKTTFWVVIEGKRAYYDADRISKLAVNALRQKKPSLRPDEIAIKITLDVDLKAFTEPVYAVVGTVTNELVVAGPALTIEQPPEEAQESTPVL